MHVEGRAPIYAQSILQERSQVNHWKADYLEQADDKFLKCCIAECVNKQDVDENLHMLYCV